MRGGCVFIELTAVIPPPALTVALVVPAVPSAGPHHVSVSSHSCRAASCDTRPVCEHSAVS